MAEKVIHAFLFIIVVLALGSALGLLLAFPLKWCWNYTMPAIFQLPAITWGQAWCLGLLSYMLIKPVATK